jgi:aminomethyltransferase
LKWVSLHGNDITTSPAGWIGLVHKFTKEFTNSENLKKTKEREGVTRKLVAFEMQSITLNCIDMTTKS